MSNEQVPSSPVDITGARIKNGSAWARLPKAEDAVAEKPDQLDSPEKYSLFRRLLGFYVRELRRQETNRFEQATDEDYYDNIQWDPADVEILRRRNQVPIVYNVIASMINWIIGTEKRSRTDYRILPRRKEDSKPAERKSQLMKYLSDINRSPFSRSRAFEDAVKVGVGWVESGAQDEDDGEQIYDRHESWRNMLWDSASVEPDLSDARYVCRAKWVDEDVAIALFPGRAGLISQSVVNSESFIQDNSHGDDAMDSQEEADGVYSTDIDDITFARRRVRLIEVWFRKPVKAQKIKGGMFSGELYEDFNEGHRAEIEAGNAVVSSSVMMRVHVAIITVSGLLHLSESPYRHNRFPFTPIWCYRRGRNNMPYGVIRGVRTIQQDINKRAAKALAIISSNKVVMDKGAVDDLEEFADEVAKPDAIIEKKKGYELELSAERELAPAHLELMSRGIAMIQSVSGVTDENMGRTTNARSGIAIQARQNQGALSTAGIFDNLRLAVQVHGEKQLSLIEQYFTEAKAFRITNMRGNPEYVTVNDGLPENAIARSKADFIISEDEWRATVRQQQTETLIELLRDLAPVAPQAVIVMLDLLIEKMDIPNREEIVRRIRQVTGARDPDAEEPSPEEMAMAQEKAKQAAMQEAAMVAEIEDKQASGALKAAQARKVEADVASSVADAASKNVTTQKSALEAATIAMSLPAAVPVADGMLHEAGFRSRTEDEDDGLLMAALADEEMKMQQEQMAAQEQAAQAQQPPQPDAQQVPVPPPEAPAGV